MVHGAWTLVWIVEVGNGFRFYHLPSTFQASSPRLREVEAGIHILRTNFYHYMYSLPVPLEHYSYAKLLNEIIQLCHKRRFTYQVIGYAKTRFAIAYPIYKITIAPEQKKIFCIEAGTHGYEIAGPLAILELLKNPARWLNKNLRYEIYPLVNPAGFDLRCRENAFGRDVNNISPQTMANEEFAEAKILAADIKNKKLAVFLSLHEDNDMRAFYAYVYERTPQTIYRQVIAQTAKICPIFTSKLIHGAKADGHGLIIHSAYDKAFHDFFHYRGQTAISITTETPGLLPLAKRIQINLNNIKLLSQLID